MSGWYNRPVRLAALLSLCLPLAAQWVDYPSAGVPRLADGKPNFAAPAPKTITGKPDFSGMWMMANPLPCDGVTLICGDLAITPQFIDIGTGVKGGLPYQPWVRELMKQRRSGDDPYTNCISPGGPRMHLLPTMKKVIQTPQLLVILDEYNAGYRQIFLDGRKLPVDPQPTWNGYSSAHWDGDALVVNSIGFRDDQWLDTIGSRMTSAAKVTEKFHRPNFGNLEIEVTIDDAKAFTKPWTVTLHQTAVVDTEMLDAICTENEKDAPHLPHHSSER